MKKIYDETTGITVYFDFDRELSAAGSKWIMVYPGLVATSRNFKGRFKWPSGEEGEDCFGLSDECIRLVDDVVRRCRQTARECSATDRMFCLEVLGVIK